MLEILNDFFKLKIIKNGWKLTEKRRFETFLLYDPFRTSSSDVLACSPIDPHVTIKFVQLLNFRAILKLFDKFFGFVGFKPQQAHEITNSNAYNITNKVFYTRAKLEVNNLQRRRSTMLPARQLIDRRPSDITINL